MGTSRLLLGCNDWITTRCRFGNVEHNMIIWNIQGWFLLYLSDFLCMSYLSEKSLTAFLAAPRLNL